MARIETEKDINPTQLGVELGRVTTRSKAGVYVEAEGVTEADLQAAVDAHVADPNYVDPEHVEPPDPQAEFEAAVEAATTIAELKAALLGTSGREGAAAARRPNT